MVNARTIGATLLIGGSVCLLPGQASAQAKVDDERVDIIVSQPDVASEKPGSLRGLFKRIKARVAAIAGHALPMTRCEKWSVAKKDLEKVKREASKRGVVITQLGSDWRQLMHATDGAQLDEKQKRSWSKPRLPRRRSASRS